MGGLLAIFAHPDDETFGCGGVLALHAMQGHKIQIVSLTCSKSQRRDELRAVSEVLGIGKPIVFEEKVLNPGSEVIRRISKIITELQPEVLITHIPFDYHREHRIAHELVKEAVEWAGHTTQYDDAWVVKRLLLMEVNTLIPDPHVIVDISKVWKKKKTAIGTYSSQLTKFSWNYYQDFMEKKAELRGVQGGCRYAEAFLIEPTAKNSPFFPIKATESLIRSWGG
jgi:LmbE family N-acetylglucosaminyl deacetylase